MQANIFIFSKCCSLYNKTNEFSLGTGSTEINLQARIARRLFVLVLLFPFIFVQTAELGSKYKTWQNEVQI